MTVINSQQYPAIRVSRWKRFLRSFFIWQIFRFFWINLKMSAMIIKSHGSKNPDFIKK